MQTIILDNAPTGRRLIAFWVDAEFPTGEYQLVPVGEAGDKDARIAELEKQLANRSPGVMPDVAEKLLGYLGRGDVPPQDVERDFRSHFAPPDGHEWRRVTENDPVTAEDVGRRVCRLNETVSVFGASSGWSTTSEVYILRPIAAKFVFTGEPGHYHVEKRRGFAKGIFELVKLTDGRLFLFLDGRQYQEVNADGTFAGGRITGRVE